MAWGIPDREHRLPRLAATLPAPADNRAYAIEPPTDVDINAIVIRLTRQSF